ncbi:MAG: folate-binding protein [Lysobacteraceae bacterium]
MIGKLESRETAPQNGQKGSPFALPGWSILALKGPDALAFAQSQLMNDLARLGDGQWQWNGWLNPKGRVIALCLALRRDAETLWLLLPDLPASELAASLQRYVFRSKLRLTVVDDWQLAGSFVDSPEPPDCLARAGADEAITLHFGITGDGENSQRRLHLLPQSVHAPPAARETLSSWLAGDLRAGLPHLDAEQREQHTPQMLALDRLRAYSVKKGCYPGQEIVSRTHFLGKAKRRLSRLRLPPDVEVAAGDVVTDEEGRPLSTLIDVADTSDGIEALAVLDDDSTVLFNGRAAERLPLLDYLPC